MIKYLSNYPSDDVMRVVEEAEKAGIIIRT